MLASRISSLVSYIGLDVSPAYRLGGRLFPLNTRRGDRKPGSFWVHLEGPKQGRWRDAADGSHGDALDLLTLFRHNGDAKAAFKDALEWLGLKSFASTPEERAAERARREKMARDALAAQRRRERDAAQQAEKLKKAAKALWLSGHKAEPGGLCDLYLRGRGIDWAGTIAAAGHGMPGCVRELWNAKAPAEWQGPLGRTEMPALLLAVNDATGHIGTHRIYLDVRMDGMKPVSAKKALLEHVNAEKAAKLGPKSKFLYGLHQGGSIRVWKGPTGKRIGEIAKLGKDDPTAIMEGFEDACAFAVALFGTDDECRVDAAVSLGNMGLVQLPACIVTRYLVGDNDASAEARAAFDRAAEAHAAQGAKVWKMKPPAGAKDVNEMIVATATKEE